MGRGVAIGMALAVLVGCGPKDEDPAPDGDSGSTDTTDPGNTTSWGTTLGEFDDAGGLSGAGLLNPYPNPWLIEDGKVSLPQDEFPATDSPFPVLRVSYRTGFSPVQPIILRMPDIDCSACPTWGSPTPGEGSVLLYDRTTLTFLPVMAELDAYPGAVNPTLIIRPQAALPYNHDIAVVVTTDAVARPARFEGLADGTADSKFREHYIELMAEIGAMGVAPDDVAIAWDFPIGDGTRPLRSVIEQVEPIGSWVFNYVKDADEGDNTPNYTWRAARGSFDVQNFLKNDKLELNTDGSANLVDLDGSASLVAIVPESVKDAPAGSVPVMIYGHGLLSSPKLDLYDFSSIAHEIASELGVIIIATPWGGLDAEDMLVPVSVANDFAKMPRLSGHMIQGQANQHALIHLAIDGDLLDDPIFQGVSGQKLADVDSVTYWGMSLGGILGGVLMSQGAPIDAAVFHVGGGGWSTLLERSANWTQFEFMVLQSQPKPEDRQTFYAVSQLFWDAVDPMAYTDELKDKTILMQESYGDDAVCNMASRMLARSIDLPILTPSVDTPYAMDFVSADLPPGSRAIVQFDAEQPRPADVNRPADFTGAHPATAGWDESMNQAIDFLTPGMEGQVNHYCGESACTASTVQ